MNPSEPQPSTPVSLLVIIAMSMTVILIQVQGMIEGLTQGGGNDLVPIVVAALSLVAGATAKRSNDT